MRLAPQAKRGAEGACRSRVIRVAESLAAQRRVKAELKQVKFAWQGQLARSP